MAGARTELLLGRPRRDHEHHVTTRSVTGNTAGNFRIGSWALALVRSGCRGACQLRCCLLAPLPKSGSVTLALVAPTPTALLTMSVTLAGQPPPPVPRRFLAGNAAIPCLRP